MIPSSLLTYLLIYLGTCGGVYSVASLPTAIGIEIGIGMRSVAR